MEKEYAPEVTALYVEDENVAREQLAVMIRRRVDTLWTAANGREGLEVFEARNPDLVITDIRMPGMDGLEMARRIREVKPEIKIVATTAFSEAEYLLKAIEVNIDHYILKPVKVDQLKAVLEKCRNDIVAMKKVDHYHRERDKLVVELQSALDEIRVLQSILPICSFCKKIRNDKGYWEDVDSYLTKRMDARFSHSLCEECLRRHYPEEYDMITGGGDAE